MTTVDKTKSRWGSSAAFIISSIAAAIGLGNIWKFPYIVHQYGGGAILICYLISLALLAFPVLIAEIALGKKLRLSTFYTFKTLYPNSKIWKIFGFIVSTTPFIILSYYTIVAGWTLEYTWQSLTGNLHQMAAGNGEEYFVNFVTNPFRQIGYFTLSLVLILLTVLGGTERI